MKMKSLHTLAICMDRAASIHAAPLMLWLDFTKKSLTSFILENGILYDLNILDSLGGGQSMLKHLKWEAVYIPTIDSNMHSFQFLVSLSLTRTKCALSSHDLEKLLCICPSLASLWLEDVHVSSEGDAACQIKSSSLKALSVYGGFPGIDHVVLNMECLDLLTLVQSHFSQ
ncbi:hypothetical protein L7F22_054541 [Adiantum nelumboides]|nr:hypothetical protein [Adiantum nelumboides]